MKDEFLPDVRDVVIFLPAFDYLAVQYVCRCHRKDSCASNGDSRISGSKYFQMRTASPGASSGTLWLLFAWPTELSFVFRVDNRRLDKRDLVLGPDALRVDGSPIGSF
jgi:hypothetical protein